MATTTLTVYAINDSGGWTDQTGSGPAAVNLFEPIASADDADYAIYAQGDSDLKLQLTPMPDDLYAMTGMTATLRVRAQNLVDDSITFGYRIEHIDTTVYATTGTTTNVGGSSFSNTSSITFTVTAEGLAATRPQWSQVRLVIIPTYNTSMSNDGATANISALEVVGTYTQTYAGTLYARTAGGNWGTPATWSSTSSAGSAASVPAGSNTDVIFDAGSGNVTLDGDSACKSFVSTNYTGTFDMAGADLAVKGSVEFGAANQLISSSTAYFLLDPTDGQSYTITPNNAIMATGTDLSPGLFINCSPSTTYTLMGDLNTGYFLAYQGTFDANDYDVDCAQFLSLDSGTGRTIDLGTGTWTLRVNTFQLYGAELTATTLNAFIDFIGTNQAVFYSDQAYGHVRCNVPEVSFVVSLASTFDHLELQGADMSFLGDYVTFSGPPTFSGGGPSSRLKIRPLSSSLAQGTSSTGTHIIYGTSGTTEEVAQSFLSGTNTIVPKVSMHVGYVGTPSDSVVVDIISGSLSSPTILGTSQAMSRTEMTSAGSVASRDFFFEPAIPLSNATTYYFRYRRTGARDTSNYFLYTKASSSSYANGSNWDSDSGVWTAGTVDLRFQVFTFGDQTLVLDSGTVFATSVDLAYSDATGGADWHYDADSVVGDGVTGWTLGSSTTFISVSDAIAMSESLAVPIATVGGGSGGRRVIMGD